MSVRIYSENEKKNLRDISKKARRLSVAEIADNMYGLSLYQINEKSGRYLGCYEHPSLVFDMKKNLVFYNAKTSNGMNCYDFVQFYENSGFLNAREKVNEYFQTRDPRNLMIYQYSKTKDKVSLHKGVLLPEKADGSFDEMKNYFDEKAFDSSIIDNLIMNGLLYTSKEYNNIVFVGMDENEQPAFAYEYGMSNDSFEHELSGSYTRVGWRYTQNKSNNLVIVDSPMSAVAYLGINPSANVVAAKNIDTVLETVQYLIENADKYKFMKELKSISYVFDNQKKSMDVLNEIHKLNDQPIWKESIPISLETLKKQYLESIQEDDSVNQVLDISNYYNIEFSSNIEDFIRDMDKITDELVGEKTINSDEQNIES